MKQRGLRRGSAGSTADVPLYAEQGLRTKEKKRKERGRRNGDGWSGRSRGRAQLLKVRSKGQGSTAAAPPKACHDRHAYCRRVTLTAGQRGEGNLAQE